LPALAQSRRPADGEEEADVVVAVVVPVPSRRQLDHIAGVTAAFAAAVDIGAPASDEVSSLSARVLSIASEGRNDVVDRPLLSDPMIPTDRVVSVAPDSAARAPGGRYLLSGGLAAAEDPDAVLLSPPRPLRYVGRSRVSCPFVETLPDGLEPLVTYNVLNAAAFSGRESGILSLFRSSSYSVMLFDENRMSALCARRTSLPMKICIAMSLSSRSSCSMTRNSTRNDGSCGAGLFDLEDAGCGTASGKYIGKSTVR
jgi:hypothetical protein